MNRQLWYNFEIDPVEQIATYFFVIINERRELIDIEQRLYFEFQPIDEQSIDRREGDAGDLFYKIVIFESPKPIEDRILRKVYRGKKVKKTRLGPRKDGMDGIERFVTRELEKLGNFKYTE